MKSLHARLFATCAPAWALCLFAPLAKAQLNTASVNWGSQDFSTIVDSNGDTIPADGTFQFELGAFATGFVPDSSNVTDWFGNWFTFDRASYVVDGNGTSVFASSYEFYDETIEGTADFQGLGINRDAYIWIYNSTTPEPGTEWLLTRASNWEFPTLAVDCCNNELPLEWSASDLTATDVPLWGNQLGTEGPGENTVFSTGYDLQTYTFVPEPSSALLVALAGLVGVMRRRRG